MQLCRLQDNIKALKLPEDQKAVALMDCWSVHKSEAFRTWWKEKYPWLLFLYIPAGGSLCALQINWQQSMREISCFLHDHAILTVH